ncbi:creatininase family protein [Thermodesulfobacteriota bacterium]
MSDPTIKDNPLEVLRVIDRLEVGPLHLEKGRLMAPYKVTRNGMVYTTQLIYRFEEDVFDPDKQVSVNLASMIAAQVAVNYGLFCKEIAFHGLYDVHDRKFLLDMARNTSREIFVKKFLEPNPFLVGSFNEIPPVKMKSYLNAELVFPEKPISISEPDTPQVSNSRKYAVLSSGGKDSLLSFGLLKEIKKDVHPIFINESGRHWFTALNAYRYFSKEVPNTSRVWTNADRIFNWMLKHLPFIRKSHANIRSDEYPIRLWTVAVFLFGALPILKKRGIGYLVIGNEFDTTRRTTFKGIPHYDGLYDQSRYFNYYLTQYFHRKDWHIDQFSILRPLSEILIEKILTERFSELQHHQISCHAAHKQGERIHPCGKCEKCRRIIAMLTALQGDPTNCGYAPSQIAACLNELPNKGLNQERSAIEHVGYLLHKNGVLKKPNIGKSKARERDIVMKVRLDPEKSPSDGIPLNIRDPLYRIFLEHSDGAVKRIGRTWMEIDPLSDPITKRPYLFEKPNGFPQAKIGEQNMDNYILGDLTWPDAQNRFKETDIALLPVGAIEQHGPHLPLDTDAFDAEYLSRAVAEACANPKPFVLPLIPYGVSYHHEDFAGTISINPETLSQLIYDVGMSAVKHGITKLVIINGHGGNGPALHFAAQMINRDAHIFTCVDSGETSDPDIMEITETPNDVHSGEVETSTTLARRPHLVKLDKAKKFIPKFSSRYLDFSSKRSVGWYAHTSKISHSGVLGDPTLASVEKGRDIWDLMIKHLVEFVEELKNLSLEEIYQRRY